MNSLADFVTLVQEELGLPVTLDNVAADFDTLPDWDSVHLLTLLALLERETQRPVSLPDMMAATSLRDVYTRAVTS
ncbi:phosphopantetheine-binding protein [Streptomyces mayteni]